jgi:hypothetical protein
MMQEDNTMSVLMLALAASMTVGNDAQPILPEMEQRLCIDGHWKGTFHWWEVSGQDQRGEFTVQPGSVTYAGFGSYPSRWVDEGRRKCRVIMANDPVRYGIYKREASRLIICLGARGQGRPNAFLAGTTQTLYILNPSGPNK